MNDPLQCHYRNHLLLIYTLKILGVISISHITGHIFVEFFFVIEADKQYVLPRCFFFCRLEVWQHGNSFTTPSLEARDAEASSLYQYINSINSPTRASKLFMLTTRSDDPKRKGSLLSTALKQLFCGPHTEERSGVKREQGTWPRVSGHSLSSGTVPVCLVSLDSLHPLTWNENASGMWCEDARC